MNISNNDIKAKSVFLVLILLTLILLYLFYEDFTKSLCYSVTKLDGEKRINSNINNQLESKNFQEQELDDRNKISDWIRTFKEIALKSGSDKVTTHHYEFLYGQYLGPLRNSEINFLEIGLGCNMNYGPGKSIILWKEFLPKATISVLEYNADCAQKFVSEVENLFIGDQSNFDVLNNIGKYGPYDVIVDDGGHSRKQQVNSLIGLWPYVKSKGYYVIEDIFTSFSPSYNDNPETAVDVVFQLILLLNDAKDIRFKAVFPENIQISEHSRKIAQDLLYISCFQRVCILNKK